MKWYNRTRYVYLILILLPLAVYSGTIFLEYTMLDDTIFIVENQAFNQKLNNIPAAFQRGLFHPTNDSYYRPLFLIDFIAEFRLFGVDPAGYHFTNLLFHILCVLLVYQLFRKTGTEALNALILSALFAVHPALSQAVAWIPGRNDTLLLIFFLSSLITILNYIQTPRWVLIPLQFLFLTLALFTKETAVAIPVIALVFILLVKKASARQITILIISWVLAFLLWYSVRASASLKPIQADLIQLLGHAIERSPVILHYLGKLFLPVNLAVFPAIDETCMAWGILAIILLLLLVIVSRSYGKPLTIAGFIWFLIFLMPVLMVPPTLNDQSFEHRLYVPSIGILLILGQTFLFQRPFPETRKLIIAGSIVLVFSILTVIHIRNFATPLAFWSRAVNDNPSSSYARMMLGLRQENGPERKRLFEEAFALNPDERTVNYFLGKISLEQHNLKQAEFHFQRERELMEIPDNYFCLARVFLETNRFDSAAWCLERVISLDPGHQQAHVNLALLNIQVNRPEEAARVVELMKQKGLFIPEQLPLLLTGKQTNP